MAEAAFGAQLRHSRQSVGLSLRQLATRVGYDHSYLSQVERGQRPGSADLARLCDRELGTGDELTTTFEQRQPQSIRSTSAALPPAGPLEVALPTAGPLEAAVPTADALEAAWHGLITAFGCTDVAADLGDFRSVPPAHLLPDLTTYLQVVQARGSTGSSVQAAELSVLTAVTLTGCGELRAARRWWQVARSAADSSANASVRSSARAREAMSGLAEPRPLMQLLATAEEALALARQAQGSCVVEAHAARARVLAELGRRQDEAHWALQELIGVADELPSASTTSGPLGDWAAYEVHGAEGRVCASLGYGAAGCVLLARALELCPVDRLGERAGLELWLAQCLAVDGEVAAGVALALRVLVELPHEWHTYYLYDDAGRVVTAARERAPGLAAVRDLEVLLERKVYAKGRSVGSGSWSGQWRG
ncbi:helix-turn-helix domain-containing protein [Kribbella sp. NBC_01484]|uniref:helix-turn-helix domain-containing protein n=1 Tax=Kribbella sp. NBC_01484 TaxID=2903579 RepID=UPI002E32CF1A|nr:helix-turn-helix transcriptional regulator [Kribbella sp. NBC_01484]